VELAHVYEIGVPPPWWWDAPDEVLATLLVLLGEQQERIDRQTRKHRR
jgi:hypothetical protein